MRRLAALTLFSFALVGCGDDAKTDRAADPTPEAASTPATDDVGAESNDNNARFTSLALLRGQQFISTYCVHVLGERVGQEVAPSSAQRAAKNTAIQTMGYTVRDSPDFEFEGKTLSEFLREAETLLASAGCDETGAKKVQALSDKLTSSGY